MNIRRIGCGVSEVSVKWLIDRNAINDYELVASCHDLTLQIQLKFLRTTVYFTVRT